MTVSISPPSGDSNSYYIYPGIRHDYSFQTAMTVDLVITKTAVIPAQVLSRIMVILDPVVMGLVDIRCKLRLSTLTQGNFKHLKQVDDGIA